METINIIVSHPEQGINEIETFGILDQQLRDETVSEAEDCFINTAVKYQFGEDAESTEEQDDFRDCCSIAIEEGTIDAGGHTVSIVWSYINNVQL